MSQPKTIAFVVPLEVGSLGCRALASVLKQAGHRVRIIFIPNMIPEVDGKRYMPGATYVCSETLKNLVLEKVQGADIVGFSVLTAFYEPLAQLSALIREQTRALVVWGGIHATMDPESCVEHADVICLGDGEHFMLELIEAIDSQAALDTIPGAVCRLDGETRYGPFRRCDTSLAEYPDPDFSFEDYYLIDGPLGEEAICPLTPEIYVERGIKSYPAPHDRKVRLIPYKILSGRGCPYQCSYCNIGSQKTGQFPYRKRSVAAVIAELEAMLSVHRQMISIISFSDDTFMLHTEAWMDEFAAAYKSKIGLPFRVLAHPNDVTERKIELLCDAGCVWVGMGIESLSPRILGDYYNRPTRVEKVIASANVLVRGLASHKACPPTFDIIIAEDFETLHDRLLTFRGLTEIDRPLEVALYYFNYLPGTELYKRAIDEGWLSPDSKRPYRIFFKAKTSLEPFLDILYELLNENRCPNWFLRFLSSTIPFALLNWALGRGILARERLIAFFKRAFLSRHFKRLFRMTPQTYGSWVSDRWGYHDREPQSESAQQGN